MAKSVKGAVMHVLEDLLHMELQKFNGHILGREGPPKVRRGALENKNCVEIADTLVTTYTECGVIDVVLDTLEQIGCNEQRETFEMDITEASQKFFTTYGEIMKVETTGASWDSAKQDKLTHTGIKASHDMAETDLMDMNNYKKIIKKVARQKGVDPALIAAIISRSCRAGKTLKEGQGCYNEERRAYDSFGLMQLDVNPNGGGHIPRGSWNSEEHISQGTDILIYFILCIQHKFTSWSKEQQLKGGIAAYHAGDGNIESYEKVDAKTCCGDYSNDVVARAQWFKTKGGF